MMPTTTRRVAHARVADPVDTAAPWELLAVGLRTLVDFVVRVF
jgi:hypothetical protein